MRYSACLFIGLLALFLLRRNACVYTYVCTYVYLCARMIYIRARMRVRSIDARVPVRALLLTRARARLTPFAKVSLRSPLAHSVRLSTPLRFGIENLS